MNTHTMISRGVRKGLVAGGLGLGILLASGAPAVAQSAPSTYGSTGGGDTTRGVTATRPAAPAASSTQVRGVTQTRANQLPVTGSDVAGLAAVGAGLLAVGAVAVKTSRRSPVGA
jgi:hypothetical protein